MFKSNLYHYSVTLRCVVTTVVRQQQRSTYLMLTLVCCLVVDEILYSMIYIDVITFNLMYDLLVFMCADVNGAISCYLLYNIFKATPLSLFYMLETGL